MRNLDMIARIETAPVAGTVRFAFAGDSGAWADPTAEAIFAAIVRQVAALRPHFFANLGDFAGPGTLERHDAYLRAVAPLDVPNVCVVGNHDLDDPGGWAAWERVHGPANFDFAVGHTRFVAIHAAAEPGGHDRPDDTQVVVGPLPHDLAYLDDALMRASEPHRVVLMHMPPALGGHYAPHANWGFGRHEDDLLEILHRHRVQLVCCAHGLLFDEHVHEGVRFVMSGGGGTGLCSHRRGVCVEGEATPEDRGALFHFVEVAITAAGDVAGRVVQAFAEPTSSRIEFGAEWP